MDLNKLNLILIAPMQYKAARGSVEPDGLGEPIGIPKRHMR